MADQSDVETALVTLAAAALYPDGPEASSTCGQPCRIYRGWPNPAGLDADLALGLTQVTVAPVEGTIRNTTRNPDNWLSDAPAATLTAATVANTVVFGGTADPGQLVGLAADGRTFVYRTQSNDTPALVAANIGAQARTVFPTLLAGTAITLIGAAEVIARVVADATARLEIRRQVQRFRLVVWCNDPLVRDATAIAVDLALTPNQFIGLGDGTQARLVYAGSATFDRSENASLYRRDLLYDLEYGTNVVAVQPSMLFGVGTVNSTAIIG